MKKLLVVALVLTFCFGCDEDEVLLDTSELLGQWKLIEQLADPGDGSGTFESLDSRKIIEFHVNQKITAKNGSLCEPYSEEQIASGTYSPINQQILTNCQNVNIVAIGYELKEGHLILNFASNEGFSQKFKKIK